MRQSPVPDEQISSLARNRLRFEFFEVRRLIFIVRWVVGAEVSQFVVDAADALKPALIGGCIGQL